MKNIVTFETAKRLKEVGFPPPEPGVGQFWHNPDFGLFLVGRRWYVDGTYRNIFYIESGKAFEKGENDFSECIFAPTATDILRDIKLSFHDLRPLFGNKWAIHCHYDLEGDSEEVALHENPAEAAAAAWLHLNEKK